jgi:hypothetical protein
MNLDELMTVWKSQDVAPLHDMNKPLLHRALRQEEVKLQKARCMERWMVYVFGTGFVVAMAVFLGMMLADERDLTGWDFVIGMVGAAAALLAGGAMYVTHRTQARREEHFGESLRDQLNRRIAQLDHAATSAPRTSRLVIVTMGVIAPLAMVLLSYRTNQKPLGAIVDMPIPVILGFVWCLLIGAWEVRRGARKALAHKLRLEALLKELDDQ